MARKSSSPNDSNLILLEAIRKTTATVGATVNVIQAAMIARPLLWLGVIVKVVLPDLGKRNSNAEVVNRYSCSHFVNNDFLLGFSSKSDIF